MTERQEELAALEALHMLEAEEARVFAGEVKYAPRVAEAIAELQHSAAELALLVPPMQPPPGCRTRILAAISNRPNEAQISRKKSRIRLLLGTAGWLAAAALAFACVKTAQREHLAIADLEKNQEQSRSAEAEAKALQVTKTELEKQIATTETQKAALAKELDTLKHTNALASLEVESLRSQKKEWEDSVAVIVWDNVKQEGVLKLRKMHPAAINKDFQLWVVDKDNPDPISAGVVKITNEDLTVYTFKPASRVYRPAKFAVSIENKGGVPKKEGPLVLLSP